MKFFNVFKNFGLFTVLLSAMCLAISFTDFIYEIPCNIGDFIKLLGLFCFIYSIFFILVYMIKIIVCVMKNKLKGIEKDFIAISLSIIVTATVWVVYYNINVVPTQYLDKPIIYLYPDKDTEVTVKLSNPNSLTHTYPKYESEWKVYAKTDGTLTDLKTNRKLYALYWEAIDNSKIDMDEGFIVEGKDIVNFLEEKLEILGLNYKESQEFIIYWLPILENNKYNFIRFRTQDEIDNYMKLDINPKPDTIIRVIMDFKRLDKKINIKEQTLENKQRIGFTLVEWGARELK